MNRSELKGSYINMALIAANVIFFFFLTAQGRTEYDMELMLRYGACYEPLIVYEHQYWRLFTACFMHFGMAHLVNNMLVLFALGDPVERELGHLPYLVIYLLSGIGGNIFSAWYNLRIGEIAISAGASGAVFGVMGMLLWMVMRRGGTFSGMPLNRLIASIALSIYLGMSEGGVDVAAHVGGLICGFVLCILLYRPERKRRTHTEWDLM